MNIQAFKILFFTELSESYDQNEIQSFFNLLTEFRLQKNRADLVLQSDLILSSSDITFFKNALSDLKTHKPIQYIIGETTFYGLKFKVTRDVLIPRPETEELVDWILNEHPKDAELHILDLGTGSGCIALSLAKNLPNSTVTALDVSREALGIARENAILNSLYIKVLNANILSLPKLPEQYDIIVSNPPYVRLKEKEQMQLNVLENEPHQALFVENDLPLLFYDRITTLALTYLKPKGELYFEINQYLGPQTVSLIQSKGFQNVQLKKDFYGVDRMIKAIKN